MLGDRGVMRFVSASSLAMTATNMQAAALGKQIYDITDSELLLGLLGLVEFGPSMFLLPLTGSLADRLDRRKIASIGICVQMLTAIAYCLYTTTDPTSVVPIFVVAGVFGTARAFVSPAVRSVPPLIAPPRGLPRVMAFYSVTWQIGAIVGPAASGVLYEFRRWLPYAVAAVLYAAAASGHVRVRLRRAQDRLPVGQRATWHHAIDGLRFVRSRPVLLGAISLDMFAVLFGSAVAVLPAIAEDRLGVGNVGYGWLRAAPGIGALVVSVLIAIRPVRRHVGRWLFVVVAVFGVMTIVLGTTRNYTVAFVALIALAGADAVSVFIRTTILPLATPGAMQGRVSAVENVFLGASNELGAFESGVTSALFGVGPAVVLGGALTLVVVGVWAKVFPPLREIDRFAEVEQFAMVDSGTGTGSDPPLSPPGGRIPSGE